MASHQANGKSDRADMIIKDMSQQIGTDKAHHLSLICI